MTTVWVFVGISAAFFAAGLACVAWPWFGADRLTMAIGDELACVVGGIALLILAMLAAAVAGIVYLFATTKFS